jgi:hypothetical protein
MKTDIVFIEEGYERVGECSLSGGMVSIVFQKQYQHNFKFRI